MTKVLINRWWLLAVVAVGVLLWLLMQSQLSALFAPTGLIKPG
jgi:hypothetical protein